VANVRVYPNERVRRVIAAIPPGHKHVRLVIELEDQTIVLQEATAAAIARAYVDVVTHPVRRAVELAGVRVSKAKCGYAEHQLVESGRGEEEVLAEIAVLLSSSAPVGEAERGKREKEESLV
jgi:hypothetical protein